MGSPISQGNKEWSERPFEDVVIFGASIGSPKSLVCIASWEMSNYLKKKKKKTS